MADLWALDYSFSRPSPAAIVAAGYVAVLRYLSGGRRGDTTGKDLSIPERDALLGAGLDLGLVWETTALRATQGFQAGADDAARANAEADGLGAPAHMALYYAVDGDVDPRGVAPYFAGVVSIVGRPAGVYGSVRVVDALVGQVVRYGWQTAAWSGHNLSAKAQLYQTFGPHPPVAGNPDFDADRILAPGAWGSWHQALAPAASPDPFVLLAAASQEV